MPGYTKQYYIDINIFLVLWLVIAKIVVAMQGLRFCVCCAVVVCRDYSTWRLYINTSKGIIIFFSQKRNSKGATGGENSRSAHLGCLLRLMPP